MKRVSVIGDDQECVIRQSLEDENEEYEKEIEKLQEGMDVDSDETNAWYSELNWE